jgi:hypothetical protein
MRAATILTFLAIVQTQQIAAAEEFPGSPSIWYGEIKRNDKVVRHFCLQVTEPLVPIVDHRATPRKCAAISGTISSSATTSPGDLVSGYFCPDEAEVGFFTLPLPSDNSLAGPEIFLGRLSTNRIMGGYYAIESNDSPRPYAGIELHFDKVEKCER